MAPTFGGSRELVREPFKDCVCQLTPAAVERQGATPTFELLQLSDRRRMTLKGVPGSWRLFPSKLDLIAHR